jgi:hypothetical protein
MLAIVPEEPIVVLEMLLRTNGRTLRTALMMPEIESGELTDEQETMLLISGRILRIILLTNGTM